MRQITDMRHTLYGERDADWRGAHARSAVSDRQSERALGLVRGGRGWRISPSTTSGTSETMMGGREGAMMMYEGNNWHDWVIISDGRSVGCSGRLMRWAVRETEIYWSVRCLLKSADREIKHGRPFCLVATQCRGCHSSIHILQTFMSIRNIGIVICVYWKYCLSAPNSYCMSLSLLLRGLLF